MRVANIVHQIRSASATGMCTVMLVFVDFFKSQYGRSNPGCALRAKRSRRLLLLFQRAKYGYLTKQLVVLCGKTKNIHKIVRPPLRLYSVFVYVNMRTNV